MVMDARGIMAAISQANNAKAKGRSATKQATYAAVAYAEKWRDSRNIIDTERLKVTQKNFGWVEVTYRDPSGETVTFKVRPKFIKELQTEEPGHWNPLPERAYKKWRESTKAGHAYGVRRQVEGMLKTARKKGMDKEAAKIQEMLDGDPKKMEDWYDRLKEKTTNMEWDEFFAYDNTVDESGLTAEDFET